MFIWSGTDYLGESRRWPLIGDASGLFDRTDFPKPDALEHEAWWASHPVLHIVRYTSDKLGEVCNAINATGYGLTLGVHSRIEETAEFVRGRVHVGNMYVNRNQIGAVVGVQPFGGEGLSGTGPKAGGPHYLQRFALERTYTVNTTAAGGNAALLSSEQDGI